MGLPEAGSPSDPASPFRPPRLHFPLGPSEPRRPGPGGLEGRGPSVGAGEAGGGPESRGGGHCSRGGGRPSPEPLREGRGPQLGPGGRGCSLLPAVFSGVGCAKGGLLLREVRPPPPAQSESSTFPPLLQPAPQPLCSLSQLRRSHRAMAPRLTGPPHSARSWGWLPARDVVRGDT